MTAVPLCYPSGTRQNTQSIRSYRGGINKKNKKRKRAPDSPAGRLERARRVQALRQAGNQVAEDRAVELAEVEVCQALNVVTNLTIEASGRLSDVLGASATLRPRVWTASGAMSAPLPLIIRVSTRIVSTPTSR